MSRVYAIANQKGGVSKTTTVRNLGAALAARGKKVRKAIEAMHGPMPEDLPPAASIRKMVEERRRALKKRKLKAENQDQDTLFQE